ncbi:MAG: benzoate-CoA ligase family protein [Acidimicrobiales bacterium]|nr:benzoate-CoA ligase family protein [Acidimicrobiales bacterium]
MTDNAVSRFLVEPAKASPDTVALIDAPTGQTTTRQELLEEAQKVARLLLERGVVAEQRVLMCCLDTKAFLAWFWGTMWIGAVPVPVSTMLTEKDYDFLLADSRAVGLVVSTELRESIGKATDHQPFLLWTQTDDDVPDLQDKVKLGEPFPAVDDDIAFWLYTSGTTGFPKGAMHRHIDLAFCTDMYAKSVLEMNKDDVIYSVAKLFFAYGLGNAGYFPAGTGARTVLNPGRPLPEAISDHVRAHRPTIFFGVPTSYGQLLSSEIPDDTFESVRIAVSAGEPLPADIHRRFKDRFGVEILDGLGTTELAHIAISNRPGRSVAGTSGTVVDGYEISIRDEIGNEVAEGEAGTLHIKGESVMVGYWNRTERTRRALVGEFLATGDTYVRNSDGTYSCLGRSDDMLKVGGIWVSPTEVESCVLELAEISQVAVVGAEDEEGLIKPKAYVVLEASSPRTEISTLVQEHVRSRLAPYKYPRWVEIVEELPQTATGKIKRYLLRS